MAPKKRILFILPTLKAGGAERVMSFVASNLDRYNFKCYLIVIGYQKDQAFETPDLEVIFLNKKRVLDGVWSIFKKLATLKPDIVVGSISHVNRILALYAIFYRTIKFVGREASVSSEIKKFSKKKKKKNPFKNFLRDYFKYLDAVICQSDDMAQDFIKNRGIDSKKIVIINNPITKAFKLKQSRNSQKKQLITIGRLSKEKGYFSVLNVVSKLGIDYHYTIIGDGPEKDAILEHAKTLHILDKTTHITYTNAIEEHLLNSDVFLQGSYVEGFPNALLESCATGVPVLAFNAPGGTKEIIQDNVNGFMVNNEQEYLQKLNFVLSNNWDHNAIQQSVMLKFGKENILKAYETLFLNLLKNN
jgi:glycosyltransferase involved in cell wall biosynthesis